MAIMTLDPDRQRATALVHAPENRPPAFDIAFDGRLSSARRPTTVTATSSARSSRPITDANRGDAYDGPAIPEEEHEVTMHAERPVLSVEAEAVERVRLGTGTVRDTETVSGEVRKEEIEVDDDVTRTRRARDDDQR